MQGHGGPESSDGKAEATAFTGVSVGKARQGWETAWDWLV